MSTIENDLLQGALNRLVLDDCHPFQRYALQRPCCYANGWLYHLRSSRQADGSLGYVYSSNEFFATLGIRKTFATCVSPMGTERFTQTPKLCELIGRRTGLPVLLKKVDADLYSYLRQQRGFATADNERFREDETYPEHYLNLTKLFDERLQLNRNAKQLRRRVRQFETQSIQLSAYGEGTSKSDHLVAALKQLVTEESPKHQAYYQLCRFVQESRFQEGQFFHRVFTNQHGQVHGLYIAERLSETTAGLYCAINSRAYSYATERMDVAFFQWLRESGIHRLLLGGSETAGVHHYVQKLLPIQVKPLLRPLVYRAASHPHLRSESESYASDFS